MAKNKKRDEKKTPKKVSVEAEVALLGLLLAIVSLIGLLNQGWLGSFLTFCLVFLFGSMYFIILLFNIYLGLYLFFKKKKPKVILGINGVAIILLLFFVLVASSIFDKASMSTWFYYFKGNFDRITISSLKVDLSKISMVGGGSVGYVSYALLVTLLGNFAAKITILFIVLGNLYILLKKPMIDFYKKSKEFIKKIKEKYSNKIVDEDKKVCFDTFVVSEEEMENKEDLDKKESINNFSFEFSKEAAINKKNGLTFDIFHESIFEEDLVVQTQAIEPIVDEVISTVEEKIDEEETIAINVYTNEELEFYGDEDVIVYDAAVEDVPYEENQEEAITSLPFIEDSIKVEENNLTNTSIVDAYGLLKENEENNAYSELEEEVKINCERINQKLNELNIKANVSNYIIGPCVTRYEIVPEIGVRVSSIVNIENDLKLALAAVKTRMEAPIPGKSAVGIEVANKKRYPVYLKEVIGPFKDDDSKLLVGIGKDLNNKEVVINIDKMPHLLVAGATGSGKSVCINSMIVSLLIRTTPEEVKLILIDPKKVEMLPYANMPHLLCPVVIDPKKASVALKKVVQEMDRRYDEFANNGVRNIEGYNKLMKENNKKPLANIVVIIDELADLMLVAAKEVEESIQRITQLARAAGIYLIVATQRPSVDVITGVIKANIPSRIAFSVSSQVDSRTIIDKGGAEELLGKGDMLMDISGSGALNRVQGVFVSDEEIFAVVRYVKSKYDVNYEDAFLNLEEENKEAINNLNVNDDTNNDKLYENIKDFVIRNQKASTSLLQRYFTLGYARAARMIDRLESEGVIGVSNGAKPREVLMSYNKEDDKNE